MYVGIDLGTTYCAVARFEDGMLEPELIRNDYNETLTPSVICFQPDGTAFCGKDAKEEEEEGNTNCVSAFKRNMNTLEPIVEFFGHKYAAEDLSAMMLKTLKNEAEKRTGEKIEGAVVTVPAYFEDIQRRATIQACQTAGLNFMGLLDEPVAAAMSYGINTWKEGNTIMVYDLGGGTFDVTIVKMQKPGHMEVISTNGNHQLGGINWDRELLYCICDYIEREYKINLHNDIDFAAENMKETERLKIQLSSVSSFTSTFNIPEKGKVRVTITREEFDRRCQTLVEETLSLCDNMLASKGMTWSDLNDVLLVGGSTRLPMIKEALKRKFGRPALETVNPDTAVATGAAIRARILAKELLDDDTVSSFGTVQKKTTLNLGERYVHTRRNSGNTGDTGLETDNDPAMIRVGTVVPHSLGVIAINADGSKYVNKIILRKDTQRPCKKAEEFKFRTRSGQANPLDIYVMQGEVEDAPLQNHIFARYTTDVPHTTKDGNVNVRVQYSYDENGVCDVQVRVANSNQDLVLHREPTPNDIDKFGLPPENNTQASSLNLMLCLDVSGSMMGEPIETAKQEMKKFVQTMNTHGDTSFCISVVSDEAACLGEQAFVNDQEHALLAIDQIECCMTGVCNNAHPFDLAMSVFQGRAGRNVLVVLADGMWEAQHRAIKAALKCHAQDIEICGMGFGHADESFLKAISSVDEMAIYTDSYTGLESAFSSIAQVLDKSEQSQFGQTSNETQETETWDDGSPTNYSNRY